MAPTSRRGKASKPLRTHYKRKLEQPSTIQKAPSSTTSSDNLPKIEGFDIERVDDTSTSTTSPYSTPKARRFRIPEIDTCPPAPKKQRVLSNYSLQRTPIAFFAPPDLELFFFFARRDISV
ncbi:hypothetical protein F3Y22_tig00000340pilonHSYRG00549 [Hibiscus syriacus]|uniref:Uncharacterized protein n=1 Tax=Hibiscus syriacus TaxID=106335 RepID=A0A6A3D1Q1_HIBSY|nr:cyclin-dependent protein kinase inhibitor SMR9-like [Hibiscus syriacus]KAE8735520.1 hypothetical protein F3Y22_tig00000340pilonHSYRG00549 [Hibiscus syriacus]